MLNGEPAPIQFQFAPGDELTVGDFAVSLLLTSENAVGLIEAPAGVAAYPREAMSPRHGRKGRVLRATSAKGSQDVRS